MYNKIADLIDKNPCDQLGLQQSFFQFIITNYQFVISN